MVGAVGAVVVNPASYGKVSLITYSVRKEDIEMSEFDENVGQSLSNVQTEMSPEESDKMTQDLMRLVGAAIDEWAELYGMKNLPKKIIFQQALTILNAMNTLLFK